MANNDTLNLEINEVRQLLERTVLRCKYNFRHPDVIEISQRLDALIVRMMTTGKG